MTSHYAVLGSPITHSKSPLIHNTAFSMQGIDADYEAIELKAGLGDFLPGKDLSGVSVTMPLKEEALAISNRADSLAIATNSANTLIRTDEGWDAYNTDIFGVQMALRQASGKRVAVLGTGATARSAIVAMQEVGKEVSVWGRDLSKSKSLGHEFEIEVVEKLHQAAEAPIVISSLPGGALDEHLPSIRFSPRGTLLDVAYNPWPSKAAVLWGESGKVISGLQMLIWQAIGQQRLFAGNDLDEGLNNENKLVMAIEEALKMAN
jgi:shikimate dehydrogenase